MSILKERLNEALMNKKNDINSFVWKGKKVKVGDSFVQEEIQLVNASNAQLQSFYPASASTRIQRSATTINKFIMRDLGSELCYRTYSERYHCISELLRTL